MINYEFTGETKIFSGITLNQIRCTKAIAKLGIQVGNIGGWIEKKENLSGDAWVYGDARVSGKARVSGNARIYDNAWEQSPLYIQGSKYCVYMASMNEVGIGCQIHTIDKWRENWKEIAQKYREMEIVSEYRDYVNLAIKRYKLGDEIVID